MAQPQPAAAQNRRQATRKSTRSLGYIVQPGRDEIECLLIDISRSGAQLRLTSGATKPFQPPLPIPETFVLRLAIDHTEIDCQTTWRKSDALGVRFLTGFRRTSIRR